MERSPADSVGPFPSEKRLHVPDSRLCCFVQREPENGCGTKES